MPKSIDWFVCQQMFVQLTRLRAGDQCDACYKKNRRKWRSKRRDAIDEQIRFQMKKTQVGGKLIVSQVFKPFVFLDERN